MRPGGYDVLFDSLSKQSDQRFEIIAIDELIEHRFASVVQAAEKYGLRIRAATPSKPKSRGKQFGQYNAINTGFLLSSGRIATILQDNIYLPSHFVSRTLKHFDYLPKSILGYPERRFDPPFSLMSAAALNNPSSLSIFREPVANLPSEYGWKVEPWNHTMTSDVVESLWSMVGGRDSEGNMHNPKPTEWFECGACSVPLSLVDTMGGVDEVLDQGDDAQERNIADRAMVIGYETYFDPGVQIELIDHHKFEKTVEKMAENVPGIAASAEDSSETWSRKQENSNIHRWASLKDHIMLGLYPVESPNAYNMEKSRRSVHISLNHHISQPFIDWEELLVPTTDAALIAAAEFGMHGKYAYRPEVLVVIGETRARGVGEAVNASQTLGWPWPFFRGTEMFADPALGLLPWGDAFRNLRRSFRFIVMYCGEGGELAPQSLLRSNIKTTEHLLHAVVAIGTVDGCAAEYLSKTSVKSKAFVVVDQEPRIKDQSLWLVAPDQLSSMMLLHVNLEEKFREFLQQSVKGGIIHFNGALPTLRLQHPDIGKYCKFAPSEVSNFLPAYSRISLSASSIVSAKKSEDGRIGTHFLTTGWLDGESCLHHGDELHDSTVFMPVASRTTRNAIIQAIREHGYGNSITLDQVQEDSAPAADLELLAQASEFCYSLSRGSGQMADVDMEQCISGLSLITQYVARGATVVISSPECEMQQICTFLYGGGLHSEGFKMCAETTGFDQAIAERCSQNAMLFAESAEQLSASRSVQGDLGAMTSLRNQSPWKDDFGHALHTTIWKGLQPGWEADKMSW